MSALLFRCELPGRPIVKKNTQRLVGVGKARRRICAPQYVQWEQNAMASLLNGKSIALIKGSLFANYVFHFRNKQSEADVSNLCEAPGDVLQKCGVIKDDRQIVRMAAEKVFDGQEKTVIELYQMEEAV